MATVSRTPGTSVAMTITNLHSLANSATAGGRALEWITHHGEGRRV